MRTKPALEGRVLFYCAKGAHLPVTCYVVGQSVDGSSWWYRMPYGSAFGYIHSANVTTGSGMLRC
ncbi:hypothetical protein ACIBEJ_35230 [Nonomuraea sp. NPDC050790]|uniref:hypothetical protein n=1 Tax=Nonomuraea sp. NPDC050790 TaxID=3364371 RepID=UPI0037B0A6B8